MKMWEYKQLKVVCNSDRQMIIESELPKLGLTGWELVTVISETEFNFETYYLKRPVESGGGMHDR